MFKIYRYAMIMAAALISAAAAAQNLDPTVEVSRAYEGNLVEVHKPAMEMAVPDTVQQFRLDFDYSVFDSPYKGSYEFNPYLTTMRPAASVFDPNVFYLRAGAGYRLYPVADIIWSPAFKKGFKMDVYAVHRSYVGDYRVVSPFASEGGIRLQEVKNDNKVASWKGYDFRTDAGVSGRYDWNKGVFGFDVSYLGIYTKENDYLPGADGTGAYNGLAASFGVASKAAQTFFYDVDLKYGYADQLCSDISGNAVSRIQEHVAGLSADLGPQFKSAHKVLFKVGMDMAFYSGGIAQEMARMNFTPHYVCNKGRWQVDAGVRVDFLVSPNGSDLLNGVNRQQIVYPDVHVEFEAVRNAMNIYFKAVGGTKLNTYSDIVKRNHFADPGYLNMRPLDSEIERVRTLVGFKGRIGTRFSYDLNGGYAGYANTLLDAVTVVSEGELLPSVGYSTCSKAFAEFSWLLDTERVRFDGSAVYSYYWGFESLPGVFAPASLVADSSVEFNLRRRIFMGVDCNCASARKTVSPVDGQQYMVIPGYADLGVSVEWVTSRKLSIWARGGNLLNMTIQRTPLYAEGGISFTAGICLNL